MTKETVGKKAFKAVNIAASTLVGGILLLSAATLVIAAAPLILASYGVKKTLNTIDNNLESGIVRSAIKLPVKIIGAVVGIPALLLGASAVITGIGGAALMTPLAGEVIERNKDKIEEKGRKLWSELIGDGEQTTNLTFEEKYKRKGSGASATLQPN